MRFKRTRVTELLEQAEKRATQRKQENLPNEIIIWLWLMTTCITSVLRHTRSFSPSLSLTLAHTKCADFPFILVCEYGFVAQLRMRYSNSFNESSMPKTSTFRKNRAREMEWEAERTNGSSSLKKRKLKLQNKWEMNNFGAQRLFPICSVFSAHACRSFSPFTDARISFSRFQALFLLLWLIKSIMIWDQNDSLMLFFSSLSLSSSFSVYEYPDPTPMNGNDCKSEWEKERPAISFQWYFFLLKVYVWLRFRLVRWANRVEKATLTFAGGKDKYRIFFPFRFSSQFLFNLFSLFLFDSHNLLRFFFILCAINGCVPLSDIFFFIRSVNRILPW